MKWRSPIPILWHVRQMSSTPNPLPATYLRGGTSKGIFLNRAHLPKDTSQWPPIFLGMMGSPDPRYARQLNGMGGGISSLSKICVVDEPTPAQRENGIHVIYTFVQVGIRDSVIDVSGNCGNLSSMVGVFAVDEGICNPLVLASPSSDHDLATVNSFNTNTSRLISTTFPITPASLSNGTYTPILDLPQTSIAGVPGLASQILLNFISPSGSRTGSLLPTTNPTDHLTIPSFPNPIRSSLVDATNPTVFVSAADLHLDEQDLTSPSQETYTLLETLRQQGAALMGLDTTAQAQPKIALIRDPDPSTSEPGVDVVIHALSMGVMHKAVPMTVGLCLGVAANVHGTLAWEITQRSRRSRGATAIGNNPMVRIQHPSGVVDVSAEFAESANGRELRSASVVRTGKRLMKGAVWW